MEFASLIIVAILVEAIWENLKMTYVEGKFNINMLGALLLGILVCILAKLNIFEYVGITISIDIIGYILTGIIVSRGANFVNDLFDRLKGVKEQPYLENSVEYQDLSEQDNETKGNE